ncbi:hypothetical protein Tco_1155758 [Tanacetum coccineum]
MVKMVPFEAFTCSCGEGDVVLRQSYKPESYGKLYYACPKSKDLQHPKLFFRTFNTSKLLFRTFNTSKLFSRIFKKCRVLKLQALAWKDKCTKGNIGLHMHPEQHTVNSAALLHEVLNEIEKLDLE